MSNHRLASQGNQVTQSIVRMRVVHHHEEAGGLRSGHHLKSSRDLVQRLDSLRHLLQRQPSGQCRTRGRQEILYIDAPTQWRVHHNPSLRSDEIETRISKRQLYALRPIGAILPHAIGHQRGAAELMTHLIAVLAVEIDHSHTRWWRSYTRKKPCLRAEVCLHRAVIVQMVLRQIRKD